MGPPTGIHHAPSPHHTPRPTHVFPLVVRRLGAPQVEEQVTQHKARAAGCEQAGPIDIVNELICRDCYHARLVSRAHLVDHLSHLVQGVRHLEDGLARGGAVRVQRARELLSCDACLTARLPCKNRNNLAHRMHRLPCSCQVEQ